MIINKKNIFSIGIYGGVLIFLGFFICSCIKNDIPYARIQANFLSIEAEGQDAGAQIDSTNLQINLFFPEQVDISKVKIESYSLTPGAYIVGDSTLSSLDLTEPQTVTVRLYQDYEWTIIGNQTIKREILLGGQIGGAIIDVPSHTVLVDVNENYDVTKIKVESIKLAPEGWSMTPDLNGEYVDFSKPVEVTVDYYGSPQIWTIYVTLVEAKVTTSSVDAGTNVAWVYGEGEAGRPAGFEYRIAGTQEWTTVPDEWMTINGGKFSACIRHLSALTTYEVRATSGTDIGATLEFTTGYAYQMPNESFDSWWLDGKVWCPWPEGGEQYWDTGNKGATTLGQSNVTPTDETSSGQGWAAKLATEFKGVGSTLGKLAAGSIFVGSYVKTDGTNGILSFGRECDQRPTKLRGYLKYTTAPISDASTEFKYMIGQPDTCIVWCALIDTPEPFEIRTNPKNQQLFDPSGDYVIAYGKIQFGETIAEYIPFEFELKYNSTSRVPKYILCTAAASKYGDYFTGGRGATLYIDDFELLYDY